MSSWNTSAGWVLLLAIVLPSVARILLSPITILLGVLIAILLCGILILTSNILFGLILDKYYSPQQVASIGTVGRPLVFSTPAAWQATLTKDQWSYKPPQLLPPTVATFPMVSKSISEILIFIVRDFILTWYTDTSTSPTFPTAVSYTLHTSVQNIVSRITKAEVPELLVRKILPVITSHVKQFREAENVVRGSSVERHLTRSEELDILLASRYGGSGKLHPAVANLSTRATRQSEEEYLRRMIDRLLPLVLPDSEAKSRTLVIVVREVLVCAVLAPLIDLLSDPDFWNRAIDEMASAAIHEQKLISKVRHVLEKGTTRRQSAPQQSENITLSTDMKLFESFLRSIERTNSLLDARRTKNDILREIRRTLLLLADNKDSDWIQGVKTEDIIAYLDRLYTAKRQVEKRITVLGGVDESHTTSQELIEGPSRLKLRDILGNPNSLSYFMEFMDRRAKALLVQFWLTVESFKDPLESFDANLSDGDAATTEGGTSSNNLREDLFMLFDLYFSQEPLPPVLSMISPHNLDTIRTFVFGTSTTINERQASRAVFVAQRQVESEMEHEFIEFQRSDLWFHAVKDIPKPQQDASRGVSESPTTDLHNIASSLAATSLPDGDSPSETHMRFLDRSKSSDIPRVRRAVSMASKSDADMIDPLSDSIHSGSTLGLLMEQGDGSGGGHMRSPLFKDTTDSASLPSVDLERSDQMAEIQAALTDIIIDDGLPEHSEGNNEVAPRLHTFPDTGEERFPQNGLEVNSSEIGEPSSASAFTGWDGPGSSALGLRTIISQLERKIQGLHTQEAMLSALIRKAELTGDMNKLHLLERSKRVIARELRELDFQKAQYEQQEMESRLIPRQTKVAIVSSAVEEEEGKTFVRYLIEVKKTGSNGDYVSGWVVARRYNEFLWMHQNLKDKYLVVRSLDFPGKRLVTSLSASFVEARKLALEKYLQSLIDISIVCSSEELLAFLSRDSPLHVTMTPPPAARSALFAGSSIVRSVYKSVTESIDDMFYGPSMLDVMIHRLTAQAASNAGIVGSSMHDEDLIVRAFKANSEANAVAPEENILRLSGRLAPLEGETSNSSFSAPICDLILAVFELDQQNNWLRRQATVIILQQVLGSTIERKFRESFKTYTKEIYLLSLINMLRESMWPRGQLKANGIPRTDEERTRTRHSANQKLSTFIPDLAASMIGRSNARRGARRIFSVLQNRRLNQHLIYTILDEVVSELFPAGS